MKIEIKSLYGSLLFEGDFSSLSEALVQAVKSGADLHGADLYGADLHGADLHGANLHGADLRGANLRGADLYGANLYGADLRGADLRGADLRGANLYCANLYGADLRGADLHSANLRGADLCGANLCGAKINNQVISSIDRPLFIIGPLGSDKRYLNAYHTDKGILLQTGCFIGSVEQFKSSLQQRHGLNDIAREYIAALTLIEKHFSIWNK